MKKFTTVPSGINQQAVIDYSRAAPVIIKAKNLEVDEVVQRHGKFWRIVGRKTIIGGMVDFIVVEVGTDETESFSWYGVLGDTVFALKKRVASDMFARTKA